MEYLRVLHLAATTMESEVEKALVAMLEASVLPLAEHIAARVAPPAPQVPVLAPLVVDLRPTTLCSSGERRWRHERPFAREPGDAPARSQIAVLRGLPRGDSLGPKRRAGASDSISITLQNSR